MQEGLSLPFFERGGGETNTQAALRLLYTSVFTLSRGDQPGVPNVAILVTDGHSNVQAITRHVTVTIQTFYSPEHGSAGREIDLV